MMFRRNRKKIGLCLMTVSASIVLAILWAVMAAPGTALAKKPTKPPGGGGGGEVGQEIPVCITFDAVSDVQSDDGTAYCDGDLKNKVTAIVGRNFNIVLAPNNGKKKTAGRTFKLNLSDAPDCSVKVDVSDGAGGDSDGFCDTCVESSPDLPTVRFGTALSDIGFPDNASLKILGRDLDGLKIGNTVDTNARLKFTVDGQGWILHWGPNKARGGWTYAPASAPIKLTRVNLNKWTFETIGDHKAFLYRDNNPPHRATEYHGRVKVQFNATAIAIVDEDPALGVWGDEPHGIIPGTMPCE